MNIQKIRFITTPHAFQAFTPALLDWHRHQNTRSLPWKGIQDPYKIWLSEIILQQTRAEQGRPYYERFIEAYPTVQALAQAPEDDVFKLWQGLGYYNRCRNLLATARAVTESHHGHFPASYEGLLALKGIGPYTAAAIASFAFNQPHAVADGNVYRVLARYLGNYTPPALPEGKKVFSELANQLLHTEHPAQWNQAIMDLGATVCTPQNPQCEVCPVQEGCYAFRKGAIRELPTRIAKAPRRQRYLHYLLVQSGNELWFSRNEDGDIWRGLYQPFRIEADAPLDRKALAQQPALTQLDLIPESLAYEGLLKTKLSHQALEIRFFRAAVAHKPPMLSVGTWVTAETLRALPLPKPIAAFFEKNPYF